MKNRRTTPQSVDPRFSDALPCERLSRRYVYPLAGLAITWVVFATAILTTWGSLVLCITLLSAVGYVLGRQEDRLQNISTMDPLTGLHTRQYFDCRLKRELRWAEFTASPLSVLVIDVDDLDVINRQYGSKKGDQVLLAVGAAIRTQLRGRDVVARWDDDEFAVLLPRTTADGARRLGGRIRHGIGQTHHALEIRISASFGVGDRTAETDMLSEGPLAAARRDLGRRKAARAMPRPPSTAKLLPSFQ